MLLTYSQEDIQKVMFSIWSYVRLLCIIVHNLYAIPIYLLINWLLLLPLYHTNPALYWQIENCMYNWLLYIVSSWSYGAGINVYEFGDDLYKIADPKSRLLVMANHQSTADVPLMMQSFTSRSTRSLLWIMDIAFKYTNFGFVSMTHGDYFLNTKSYQTGGILEHVTCRDNRLKDTLILFPEGGFRFKRVQSSNKFANKNNYPLLFHVTYPRFKAYNELMEPIVGITHIVDLTIAYEDLQKPLTILDIAFGRNRSKVLFNYRIFPVSDTPNVRSEEWLNQIWKEKEELLIKYYQNKEALMAQMTNFNIVALSWIKLIAIHLFYLSFWFSFYLCYRLTKSSHIF